MGLARKESLVLVVLALYFWAYAVSPERAARAFVLSAQTTASVALIIVSVFAALGLFGVLVDKQLVGRRLGEGTGIRTLLVAAGFGTILVGPVYAVFPLLKAFREHGARWGVVVAIMTAWAVKVPMIPLEMRFLGWEFSVVRSTLTVVAAIGMGVLFDRLMPVDGAGADSDIEPLQARMKVEEKT
jgi:uncharacterized membrane protein YraQ (UPF0718 family)